MTEHKRTAFRPNESCPLHDTEIHSAYAVSVAMPQGGVFGTYACFPGVPDESKL